MMNENDRKECKIVSDQILTKLIDRYGYEMDGLKTILNILTLTIIQYIINFKHSETRLLVLLSIKDNLTLNVMNLDNSIKLNAETDLDERYSEQPKE